jgi:iron(III) transport system substrate-binding protein
LSRRAALRGAGLGAFALASACVRGAGPAAPPAREAAAPTFAPSATAQAAAVPATPAQDTPWTTRWDALVTAARREGTLSLLTVVGRGYRTAIERFEREFPGLTVQHTAESSPGVWLGQVRQARRAGSSPFDLALAFPDRALAEGGLEGRWAPVRPLLFRPDVLDDGAWRDGVDARFPDAGGVLCFDWEYQVDHAYAVNTDLVAPDEIRTVNDLLDPRWKGRILMSDPRLGGGLLSAASVARSWGTDVLRQLLVDQRPTIIREGPDRFAAALARGQYSIALGVRPKALNPLREQGLGHNVRYLDLPDADFAATNSLFSFDWAPHPAAAALFANGILTPDAQTVLTGTLRTNSARRDLPAFEPEGVGAPGASYYEPDREANYAHTAATQRLVTALLGRGP